MIGEGATGNGAAAAAGALPAANAAAAADAAPAANVAAANAAAAPNPQEIRWGLPHFPPGLLNLSRLRHLTLSCHYGVESLPRGIGSALGATLEVLNLDFCSLLCLPAELGGLTKLTALDVEGNIYLGDALRRRATEGVNAGAGNGRHAGGAFAPAAAARSPWARDGEAGGAAAAAARSPSSPASPLPPPAFPLALRGMASLRYINLNSCGLRAVPAFVASLRSLETADLEDNELGGAGAPSHGFPLSSFPPGLVMPRLGCLNVAQCRLTDLPPAVLRSMPGLRILDLTNNALGEGALPPDLGARLPLLRALGLKRNALAAVPRALGSATALEEIYLEDNADLEVDGPLDFVADLPRLRVVMMGKQWGSWSPRSLAHVADFAAKLRARHPRRDVLRISYPGAAAAAAQAQTQAAAQQAQQQQQLEQQEQERQRELERQQQQRAAQADAAVAAARAAAEAYIARVNAAAAAVAAARLPGHEQPVEL